MPQTTLLLRSNDDTAHILRLLEVYDAAVFMAPAYALAWHLVSLSPERGDDYLMYHGKAHDTRHLIAGTRERIREAIHAYETGLPGRTVWQQPLEEFDAVLARARQI